MLEKERQEYKKFKNLEKIIFQNSFLNQKQQIKHQEFTHEKYVYINYSSKDELWKIFWDNVDKNYFLFDKTSIQDLSVNQKKQKNILKLYLLNIIAIQNTKKNKTLKSGNLRQQQLMEVKNYCDVSQKLQKNIFSYVNFKYYIKLTKFANNKTNNETASKQTLNQQINQRRKIKIAKLNEQKKLQLKSNFIQNKNLMKKKKNTYSIKIKKLKKQLINKHNMIIDYNFLVLQKIENKFKYIDVIDKNANKQYMNYIQCCNVVNQMQINLFWYSTISLFNQNIEKKITFELDELVYNKKEMTIYQTSPFYQKLKSAYKYHQQRILHNGNMFQVYRQKSVFCHYCRMVYHQDHTVVCDTNLSSSTSNKFILNENCNKNNKLNGITNEGMYGCGRSYCIYCLYNFYNYQGDEDNYLCPCCKKICNCPRCYIIKNIQKIQNTIDTLKDQKHPQLFFVDSLRLVLRKNRKNATLLPQLKKNYNYTQLCQIEDNQLKLNSFRQNSNSENIIYLYKCFLKKINNQIPLKIFCYKKKRFVTLIIIKLSFVFQYFK